MVQVTISVPDGVDPQAARQIATEALNTRASMGRVEAILADSETELGPGLLAQLALREELWREIEQQWGMLMADEVTKETGGNVENARVHTSNLRRRKMLAGVRRGGRTVYPAFQLIPSKGRGAEVAPAWSALVALVAPAGWDLSDLLLWAAAPSTWLDGRSPAEEIQANPGALSDRLRLAAQHTFAAEHLEPEPAADTRRRTRGSRPRSRVADQ